MITTNIQKHLLLPKLKEEHLDNSDGDLEAN